MCSRFRYRDADECWISSFDVLATCHSWKDTRFKTCTNLLLGFHWCSIEHGSKIDEWIRGKFVFVFLLLWIFFVLLLFFLIEKEWLLKDKLLVPHREYCTVPSITIFGFFYIRTWKFKWIKLSLAGKSSVSFQDIWWFILLSNSPVNYYKL